MSNYSNVLTKIVEYKRTVEVPASKKQVSVNELYQYAKEQRPARGFAQALRTQASQQNSAIIAEIKFASPSKGVIRESHDASAIANSYQHNGATCLSILTCDKFFSGKPEYLIEGRAACSLPVIRKDFIVDSYQIVESKVWGADCILLILSVLTDDAELQEYYQLATELGMDVLLEAHNQTEVERANKLNPPPPLIGINNRDLQRQTISIEHTFALQPHVHPEALIISESGIHTKEQIERLQQHNIYSYLVGTAFMSETDPGDALKKLFF